MSWFSRKKGVSGPDYSHANSREAVSSLVEEGELTPLLLLPKLFGGDERIENVVFVPHFVAELKNRTDENIIGPLAADGTITRYSAKPTYSGRCFVPILLTVRAYDPGDLTETIRIWGEGLTM